MMTNGIAEQEAPNDVFGTTFDEITAGSDEQSDLHAFGTLGIELMSEFRLAEQARQEIELRWLMDLRQYRGIYEPDVQAELAGRSDVYSRKTTVKVDTATARLMDLLFPANKERNYDIESSPRPSLPPFKMKELKQALKVAMQGQVPPKEVIQAAVKQAAETAANGMSDVIDDQLSETKYRKESKAVIFSGNLYGTGILKGPLVTKELHTSYEYSEEKKRYEQKVSYKTKPYFKQVPIWRFYPDMEAVELEDSRYSWEHHRYAKAGLLSLANRKGFDKDAIRNYIRTQPDGAVQNMNYELELRSIGNRQTLQGLSTGQYDVFERWGWLDADQLAKAGLDVPDDRAHEVFFANAWVLPTGEVIKLVLLPEGSSWPFQMYKFREDETCIFGEGIATVMRDDQDMINAAVRGMLDNAAIACGPQIEVNTAEMAPNESLTDLRPFRLWRRIKGDGQYPALRVSNVDSHISEMAELAKFFDEQADETSMMPRYLNGDNPTQGAAGTMGGLSMLMGQANIALKNLVVAYDEGVTKPSITALYGWNMRFNPNNDIKGDFNVIARGASSLIAKEVRAQSLQMFAATLQPEERRYVKWDKLLRERATAQELNDVVMSDKEIEAFNNDPNNKMQQEMQQEQAKLVLAKLQAEVAQIGAAVAKLSAEKAHLEAKTIETRVDSAYSAMQAGGVAATNPHIAPSGDAILQSAGYKDAPTEQPATQAPQQDPNAQAPAGPAPVGGPVVPADQQTVDNAPATPGVGKEAGIETTAIPG